MLKTYLFNIAFNEQPQDIT